VQELTDYSLPLFDPVYLVKKANFVLVCRWTNALTG